MPRPTEKRTGPGRKPPWLLTRAPGGEVYAALKTSIHGLHLHTVCEEAGCPNRGECWGGGTATVMIMGRVCTRACRFCDVMSGDPGGFLDPDEPEKVAELLGGSSVRYVVITSVDRDDLPDGGAGHFARTICRVKERHPGLMVEALIPDFGGRTDALGTVIAAGPETVAHNLEVVRRLTRSVRDRRASYELSLRVLADLKALAPSVRREPLWTKSSLMVGLGESEAEIAAAMDDLRAAGVDFLTVGQYLQPSRKHLAVHEYIPPERFTSYRIMGEEKGFGYVASGPLVRSSYRAGEYFISAIIEAGRGAP